MGRYSKPETFGIHTNLKKIVDSAGGIDIEYAANILLEDYDIELTSENLYIACLMCKDLNIRDKIDKFGFDVVMERTEREEYVRRIEMSQMLGMMAKSKSAKYIMGRTPGF